MNRAQALGYDLRQAGRVVLADGNAADEIDGFFHAVSRAAERGRGRVAAGAAAA